MFRGSQHIRSTPQTEQAHILQAPNNGGGFSFTVTHWEQLRRFLILGSAGGTYYVGEGKLTRDNAKCSDACLAEDAVRTVREIVEVSEQGRAPKQDPAIFALALCAASKNATAAAAALAALPRVCRTGTHLFQFVAEVKNLRGFGPALRRAIGHWYSGKTVDQLGYQMLKYQQRDGWSHRDVLRLVHAEFADPAQAALIRYIVAGDQELGARTVRRGKADAAVSQTYDPVNFIMLPRIVEGSRAIKAATTAQQAARIIFDYALPRELVPTEHLNSPEVWDALLQSMPPEAMIRNLGKMTAIGLVKPLSEAASKVIAALSDMERLKKARLHPLKILVALRTYQQGHGDKGSLTWAPVPKVTAALDAAFYLAFGAIEPTRKNHLLCLDVSGSMDGATIAGLANMSAREASSALALLTMRTEPNSHAMAFSSGFIPFTMHERMSLTDVLTASRRLPFSSTDCALPMLWATQNRIPVDAFVVYTDSETNSGMVHPHVALENYRQKLGRAAKLVVCGMTATNVSIANPQDAGMMDVVGFDTSAPAVMADFIGQ